MWIRDDHFLLACMLQLIHGEASCVRTQIHWRASLTYEERARAPAGRASKPRYFSPTAAAPTEMRSFARIVEECIPDGG